MLNLTLFSKTTTIVSIIAILSFFFLSTAFYPDVHSDMAVNVLIADSFSLPNDWYWWGQDRLGSFIPFISQPLIKSGLNPLWAVSVCNYLVITLGFIGFSKLFTHKRTIILFALLWFFPYQRYIELSAYPTGLSYGLLGFSFLFIRKIKFKEPILNSRINLLMILIVALIWFSAVWVSDLMYVTLLTLGISSILYLVRNKELTINKTPVIAVYSIIMITILLVIRKIKAYASDVSQKYADFNSFSDIQESLQNVFDGIYKVLMFNDAFFVSLGGWAILCFMVFTSTLIIKKFRSVIRYENFWINFFLSDFIAIILVIFISHWVFLNGTGRRYFIAPYISYALFALLLFDTYIINRSKMNFKILLCGVLIISLSPVIDTISRFGFRSTASYVKELDRLGEIGIIGDYWNSYKLSVVNPHTIKSTPHQYDHVRNPLRVPEALNQPKIYIVRDNWLDSFPDTLVQFSCHLKKKGEPLYLAGVHLCEYEVNRALVLNSDWLSFNERNILNADKTIYVNRTERIGYHSINGPKIILPKGRYSVDFYLSDVKTDSLSDELAVDVSSDSGEHILTSGFLNTGTYNREKECFTLYFEAETLLKETEFRIHETKPVSYIFHKIVVNRIE